MASKKTKTHKTKAQKPQPRKVVLAYDDREAIENVLRVSAQVTLAQTILRLAPVAKRLLKEVDQRRKKTADLSDLDGLSAWHLTDLEHDVGRAVSLNNVDLDDAAQLCGKGSPERSTYLQFEEPTKFEPENEDDDGDGDNTYAPV